MARCRRRAAPLRKSPQSPSRCIDDTSLPNHRSSPGAPYAISLACDQRRRRSEQLADAARWTCNVTIPLVRGAIAATPGNCAPKIPVQAVHVLWHSLAGCAVALCSGAGAEAFADRLTTSRTWRSLHSDFGAFQFAGVASVRPSIRVCQAIRHRPANRTVISSISARAIATRGSSPCSSPCVREFGVSSNLHAWSAASGSCRPCIDLGAGQQLAGMPGRSERRAGA